MVASAIDNSPTIQMTSVETKTGEKEERGLQDNVSIKEVRDMIEAVSALYKTLSFTRLESLKIARVCKDCLERIEEENQQ